MAAKASASIGELGAMKCVKRGLWTAAWGLWLWLGFGLYCELPRSPGPILKRLSPPTDWYHLPKGSGLVVGRRQQDGDVLIWEAATGRLVRTVPCADRRATVSPRHCVLVASKEGERGKTYEALDFRTGAWTNLNVPAGRIFDIHLDEPWAAVSVDEAKSPCVAVVDLASGIKVAQWQAPDQSINDPRENVVAWRFLGAKEVAVVLESGRTKRNRAPRRQRLERWTLDGERLAAAVPLDPPFDAFTGDPARGRIIATRDLGFESSYHVLNLRSGRSILDGKVVAKVTSEAEPRSPPQLSASGQMLLTRQGDLWNIDDARIVWSPTAEFESLSTHLSSNTAFPVSEHWNKLVSRWPMVRSLLSQPLMTMAVRDFETGAVRYRQWLPFTTLKFKSEEQGFGVAILVKEVGSDEYLFGTVHHPPRGNWPLLAICQTILALPLIILWAVFRWKRKMRMARVAP
jgi:hypothetical protein